MTTPYVICHMTSSVDGRALVPLWHPDDAVPAGLWNSAKARLPVDAAIMGRTTGEEYRQRDSYPDDTDQTFPREDHLPQAGLDTYTVVLDQHGAIAWGRSDVNHGPIIVVLVEAISDSHLAGLHQDKVHYMFAGKTEIDLRTVLAKLGALGVRRLRLGGGPATTGQFLHAGLIDEISLLLVPAIDGFTGAPTIVEYDRDRTSEPAPINKIELASSEVLDGGVLWLRYTLTKTAPA